MNSLRRIRGSVLALALLAAPALARGQALLHAQTVYADEKGVALKAPDGVACRDTLAVVSDSGNKRLVLYAMKGGGVVGGTEVKLEKLNSPGRVQLDSKGGIWVLDQKTRTVLRLDAKGQLQEVLEPKNAGTGKVVVDAFKLAANDAPVLLDGAGRRVLVLDGAGSVARQVPLPPRTVFTDIAVEEGGRLFAVDAATASLWLAEPAAAKFEPVAKGLKEYMSFPVYLARKENAFLVVDQYGHGVVNVSLDGKFRGRQSTMGWSDGQLYYPSQLCVGAEGEVIVADRNNNRVQVFAPAR